VLPPKNSVVLAFDDEGVLFCAIYEGRKEVKGKKTLIPQWRDSETWKLIESVKYWSLIKSFPEDKKMERLNPSVP